MELKVGGQLDVNAQDAQGRTFLHVMLEHGVYEVVLKIISENMGEHNFNLDLKDQSGNSVKVSSWMDGRFICRT